MWWRVLPARLSQGALDVTGNPRPLGVHGHGQPTEQADSSAGHV